jgi:transcriptional regulator with XRE-family HTH domain
MSSITEQEAQERGQRLRAFRENAGYTREALAPEAGVSVSTIVRLEKGDDPRGDTIGKIATVLGFDPVDLGYDSLSVGDARPPAWFVEYQVQQLEQLREIRELLEQLVNR